MGRHVTMVALFLDENKTHDDDDKENGKKSNRFLLTKQHICSCITLFCTFLCRRCTPCDMKLPNFTRSLYGVGEHNTDVVFFFF